MRAFFLGLLLVLSACGGAAPTRAALEIRDGWAPPTPNGVDISAGYLTIVNGTDRDAQLVAVSSPRAARVELHAMEMDGTVMRMRKIDALLVPAHGEVTLAPSARHLMFFGVSRPFAEGEHVPLMLSFAHVGVVNTVLTVQRGEGHGH